MSRRRHRLGTIDEATEPGQVQGGQRTYSGFTVLRDAPFDGQPHTVAVLVLPSFSSGAARQVRVTLSALSEAFVSYHQALEVQEATLANPFVEPTPLYTNVEGGLGAFAGYTVSSASP